MPTSATLLLVYLLLASFLHLGRCKGSVRGLNTVKKEGKGEFHGVIDPLLRSILEDYMAGCHVLSIIDRDGSQLFSAILRQLSFANIPGTVLALQQASLDPDGEFLQELRRGEEKGTCRVFLFDVTGKDRPSLAFEFMESVQLFLIRNAHVIFVGIRDHVHELLMSKELRNSLKVIYLVVPSILALPSYTLRYSNSSILAPPPLALSSQKRDLEILVPIYSRCLFCNGGKAGIHLINVWSLRFGFLWNKILFQDQFRDMQGHQMNVVQLDSYPIIDFIMDSDEISTTVTPTDSICTRILWAFAKARNFTFEMRVPWDMQWGVSTESGNWTGAVGTLQHHKADFVMSLTFLRGRMRVVDYARAFMEEPLILVVSQPRPLPPYLALINPLEGKVWGIVLLSTLCAGIILWLLQCGWSKASGKPGLSFDITLMYTWSILFEEAAAKLPKNSSGLMFIGWWWIYCTLITVSYKSSLISHLFLPGKSSTIDSLEDLLKEDGWSWGMYTDNNAEYEWFKQHTNPVFKEIFRRMEIRGIDEHIERVLSRKHALIIKRNHIQSIIVASYKDRFGQEPVYYGRSEYFKYGEGFGFRRNAPYIVKFDMMTLRLIESGLLPHWTQELVGTPKEDTQCEGELAACDKGKQKDEKENSSTQDSSGNKPLSMNHMQTIFYVLVLGLGAALIAFLVEIPIHQCTKGNSVS